MSQSATNAVVETKAPLTSDNYDHTVLVFRDRQAGECHEASSRHASSIDRHVRHGAASKRRNLISGHGPHAQT